jgi:hypothetical protein
MNSTITSAPNQQNVELVLLGIDKHWVRKNGQWIDKNLIEEEKQEISESPQPFAPTHHWWQFWKKDSVEN